jgi:hypothetical protein
MKAIPITKKLCTAGGGYASPAKIAPAIASLATKAIPAIMSSGGKGKQETTTAKPEEENKQTASEKRLFINE